MSLKIGRKQYFRPCGDCDRLTCFNDCMGQFAAGDTSLPAARPPGPGPWPKICRRRSRTPLYSDLSHRRANSIDQLLTVDLLVPTQSPRAATAIEADRSVTCATDVPGYRTNAAGLVMPMRNLCGLARHPHRRYHPRIGFAAAMVQRISRSRIQRLESTSRKQVLLSQRWR